MQQHVITAIFDVESEAYQAFSEIRQAPVGERYAATEAALLKREGDTINLIDVYDTGVNTSDDTSAGFIIGSLVGILGGPLGVLLGAGAGALVGGVVDAGDAAGTTSIVEITAAKLFDGEIAIIAMVEEESFAFDAALEQFDTTIIRYDAEDVADEVVRAIELVDEMQNLSRQQLRAERKAERKGRREKRLATLKAYYDKVADKNAKALADLDVKIGEHEAQVDARLDNLDEALSIANAQFGSATKEMMDTE